MLWIKQLIKFTDTWNNSKKEKTHQIKTYSKWGGLYSVMTKNTYFVTVFRFSLFLPLRSFFSNKTSFYFIFITSIKFHMEQNEWKGVDLCTQLTCTYENEISEFSVNRLVYPTLEKPLCRRESQMNFIVCSFFLLPQTFTRIRTRRQNSSWNNKHAVRWMHK